jgi:predicted nucleotidyltransferase
MSVTISNKIELLEKLFTQREKIKSYGVKTMGLFGSFVNEKIMIKVILIF